MASEKAQAATTARPKVAMRRTGAGLCISRDSDDRRGALSHSPNIDDFRADLARRRGPTALKNRHSSGKRYALSTSKTRERDARLDALHFSQANVEDRCRLISDVLNSSQNRFSRINPALIETKSNLNSNILKDICLICSIDFSYFQTKTIFIDVILLKRRNSIGHGEETCVDSNELDTLIAEGVGLMRSFKDALQNKVYTKSYLAAGR
jgi:RiboL-PSP-HEPN